jgi:hypothetical protein
VRRALVVKWGATSGYDQSAHGKPYETEDNLRCPRNRSNTEDVLACGLCTYVEAHRDVVLRHFRCFYYVVLQNLNVCGTMEYPQLADNACDDYGQKVVALMQTYRVLQQALPAHYELV